MKTFGDATAFIAEKLIEVRYIYEALLSAER